MNYLALLYYMKWETKMINDQENIRKLRKENEPCQRCGGSGYILFMKRLPLKGIVEEREICGCINADLPTAGIEDGRLVFKL